MAATFNLADLIPEPMTFRDVDGTAYDAHTPEMFGAVDYARMTRLRTDMSAAFSALQVKQGNPEQAEQLAADLESIADRLIALIVPDLPAERRTAMAFGHKFRFLNWWKEQQQKAASAGEAQAGGAKAIRGRRSPASSASTTSTPKTS
jgi:hypothetical protein